jgi:hypothetical protein
MSESSEMSPGMMFFAFLGLVCTTMLGTYLFIVVPIGKYIELRDKVGTVEKILDEHLIKLRDQGERIDALNTRLHKLEAKP